MQARYIQQITNDISLSAKQIISVSSLHAEGATIPFISRYRKEATGNLDEVQIGNIIEKIKYYEELEKRKDTIVKTIEAAGKLNEALRIRIENCIDANELEDIYLPYKPKRKTKASAAIEKGLEPLARVMFDEQPADIEEKALSFINIDSATNMVPDVNEALQGARDIVAEWINEHETARKIIRQIFQSSAKLSSRVMTSKKAEPDAQKYRDYFEFSAGLHDTPSHRILAIRRGEKEGFLIMDISVDKEAANEELKKAFVKNNNAGGLQVSQAIEDCFYRLLKPSVETEFRLNSKLKADEEAIRVFAENLRQLLLASPLGHKRIMAIDPGFRSGCKVVCLDENGTFLNYTTIYPHAPQQEFQAASVSVKELVKKYQVQAIGYGNGTASKETDQFLRTLQFDQEISIFMVNENGASIYSASDVAREEFPDYDVTIRGSISIGRRLLDPLSELVKIDAKSIGVGQYQHDVNQSKLKESLDQVVQNCVNYVGVDVNTASKHLLAYVSGLSATVAKNIVEYRSKNGSFKTRDEFKKVALLGPKAFEQSAGFLKIPGAVNPLDNSAVHPESYHIVEQMARKAGTTLGELISNAEIRKQLKAKDFITEATGQFTVDDILKELEKPGRDPRSAAEAFQFAEGVSTMEDLKPGMRIPGIVTNITNFGAFVDVGVKQDGLVHISHLSNKFITDPNQAVKLTQKVMVTVIEVDVPRKRIALSMKEDRITETPNKSFGHGGNYKPVTRKPEQLNPFQAKLMELKKSFKD